MGECVWIKRDLFECPNHQGYTGIRDNAGTWPLEEAQRYGLPIKAKYDRGHDHYALPIEAAPDFTNACFDDLARDHLSAKCRIKDAEIERLREVIRDTRSLVSEAAMVGFNYQDGDWPERLFLNQAKLSAALKGGKDHA